MNLDRRTPAATATLMALLLAACSVPAGSTNDGSPSTPLVIPTASLPAEPSPAASPSPSVATTPSPSPSASVDASPAPTPIPATWYPWIPPIDPTVEAAFQVDDFVAGLRQVVPVSAKPGGPPYRFDTGDPDPSTHPLVGFPKGGALVVLHGPVIVDERQWYLLTPAQISIDIPTGWSPLSAPDGTPYLERRAISCPPDPVAAEDLAELMLTDGLPRASGTPR